VAISHKPAPAVVQYAKYPAETGFGVVSLIKRHPECDILFLGTQKCIVVAQWSSKEFHIISQFDIFSSQPITDFCLEDNILIAVSEDEVGTILHFDDSILRNRDPRLNNTRKEPKPLQPSGASPDIMQNLMLNKTPDQPATGNRLEASDTKRSKAEAGPKPGLKPGDLLGAMLQADPQPKEDPVFADVSVKAMGERNGGRFRNNNQVSQQLLSDFVGIVQKNLNDTSKYKALYESIKIKKIPLVEFGQSADNLHRVDFLPDGSQIIYGKDSVHRLISKATHFIKLNSQRNVNPFFDFKMLDSGELIVFEQKTYDLVKYDPQLRETKRLKGIASACACKPGLTQRRGSRQPSARATMRRRICGSKAAWFSRWSTLGRFRRKTSKTCTALSTTTRSSCLRCSTQTETQSSVSSRRRTKCTWSTTASPKRCRSRAGWKK
jgi:hypothetical protein